MRVLSGSNINRRLWREFVASHPQGNVFQTPEFYDLSVYAEHVQPIAVAAIEGDEMVGILVAQLMTNGGVLASWLTARSIITGGPLTRGNKREIVEVLVNEYKKKLPRKTIYTEIRPIYPMEEMIGWKRVGHYNLVMRVDKSEEELWNGMHKERRRNVGQAERAGLTFRELKSIAEIQQVVELIEKTYKRKHVPIGYLNMFKKVQVILKEYAHFFGSFTVEGQMVAGQVRLCYRTLVYAWFAGSDEEYFKLRPNDFTMWNVIRWSREHGYKEFDFGGGGEPGKEYGVRDYKLKYGCEMYDYGRYILVHRPITYLAASKTYALYHKMQGK